MKQIEEVYWRDRPAEINYEAMYWTAQSEVARSTAEAVTLRADYDNIEADARELAADNETLKTIDADLRKELAEAIANRNLAGKWANEAELEAAQTKKDLAEAKAENQALKLIRKHVKFLKKELDAAWQAEPARMNIHVEDTYTLSRQFTVILAGFKDKIETIVAVRHITPLGLKEAKDLVEKVQKGGHSRQFESTPTPVMRQVSFAKAAEANKILKKAGATVYIV